MKTETRLSTALALAIAGAAAFVPASGAAQSWNLEQRSVDACQQELQFRMGSESNSRDPQVAFDNNSLNVRQSGRNALAVRGNGNFRRDRFDRGRSFSFDCTVDTRNGNTTANYRWSGSGWGGGYDEPGYNQPPAYRPPPSGGWGGGSGGSSYPPTGRVFYSGGILNRASGKGLDVQGASPRDSANIQQWDFAGAPNQTWDVVDHSGGFYQIVSVSSGKCLDVNLGNVNENGANVQQWSCGGAPNQQWRLGR